MSNKVFTFIHAADLHLGAPFKGLTQMGELEYQEGTSSAEYASLGKSLFNATYKALDRLVQLCLQRRPHALLLAGDLYNPETNGLKSLTALRQAFLRLQEAGIVVCLVHGNHDPASLLPPSWVWPENVHAFSAEKVEAVGIFFTPEQGCKLQAVAEESQDPLAVIYGISHSSAAVTDNLAKKISQEALKYNFNNSPVLQVGLVHCAVGSPGASEGEHKPYAPCSLEDLNNPRLNYWALGHIHKRSKLRERPVAVYPGNTQGLHINEQGSKGCVLVELEAGLDPRLKFCPLAGVEWLQLDFELTAQTTVSSIGDELLVNLRELISTLHIQTSSLQNQSKVEPNLFVDGYIVRLHLNGRTPLNRYLRENAEYLLASLREQLAFSLGVNGSPFIWLKDIKLNTKPAQNLELLSQQDSLLGESLRRLQAAKHNESLHAELLKDAKSPLGFLFANSSASQAGLLAPNSEEWAELLDEAAALCVDLLWDEEGNFPKQGETEDDGEDVNNFNNYPNSTR